MWWPSLLRLLWSSDPVLLHFFTLGGGREPGVSTDVSERLFSVSDKCSGLRVWRQPSSSERSMESCRGQPGLELPPPPLLWLLWCPLVKEILCLFSKGCPWWSSAGPWGCEGRVGREPSSGTVRSRFWGVDTVKLSPSSSVACRLPSELPVAREESLWDGCCRGREGKENSQCLVSKS